MQATYGTFDALSVRPVHVILETGPVIKLLFTHWTIHDRYVLGVTVLQEA